MTTTTHTPTHSNNEIIATVTGIEWPRVTDTREPIINPTLEQIQVFTQAQSLPPYTVVIPAEQHYESYTRREGESFEELINERERPLLEASFSLLSEMLSKSKGAPCALQPKQISIEVPPTNSESGKRYLRDLQAATKALATPQEEEFNHFAIYLLRTAGEPTPERLQWLHHQWLRAKEDNPGLEHPLAPLIRTWIINHIAPPRRREYDRTHPGAVMAQKSVASVRYPLVETIPEARTPPLEAPSAAQLLLPTFERKMYLPEYLPAQIVQGVMTGRDGVLPYAMRFFYEVGMSLKPKHRTGYYCRTLYDAAVDIGIIDPNSEKRDKRSLTSKKKEAIQNAIELLNEIRLPYREPVGGVGLWLPFRPQNIPTHLSEKDFPIRVWVQLPLDDKRGVLVVREIVRSLYQNTPQLNAYLAACTLFNQYGISPQGALIDPTEPNPHTPRLETGQLVHPKTGKPLFDKRGKPIDDLFHPDAFEPLKPYRPYRKEADNYPTLEEEEILRAVYPHEPYKKNKQDRYKWVERAWEAWEAIAQAGYIRIEPKGDGLQILPSDSHVRLHHEVLKSSQKGRDL